MSIEKDKSRKTYTVRWYETDTDGTTRSRKKRGFRTKREAKAFEDSLEAQKETATVGQLMNLYIDSLNGSANENTKQGKRRMLEMYAGDLLPRDVRQITRADMNKWRGELAGVDLNPTTKNRIVQALKSVSKYGADYYDFPDFAKLLKPFRKTSDDVHEINIISPEEFRLIIDNIDNEEYQRFFTFLYHTGMRRGEAMGLLKSDIRDGTASINKSVRRSTTGRTPLKNQASKRIILLDDKAMEAIEPLMNTEGEYLFGEHRPLSATNITRYFNKGLEGAGLPHYRIHDLRHSFISLAILNGVDIVTVSKYVGHSDIQQTLNTYSHLLKDSEKRMIDQLNKIL